MLSLDFLFYLTISPKPKNIHFTIMYGKKSSNYYQYIFQ